jgi:hypothetical protein
MWSGTAGSWIDLNIPGIGSVARDLDAGQQVGDMADFQGNGHAMLWSGTAASAVDLSPAGTWDSIAYAVHAGTQVGTATTTGASGGPAYRAYAWTGTAASAVNLHSFLPSNFYSSEARDVWSVGGVTYVAGFGMNSTTGRFEALLWGFQPPHCPADLDNGSNSGTPDGAVDINDLLFFLVQFEGGADAADLDNGSGTGTPDGGVDINDLLYFLVRFEAGC